MSLAKYGTLNVILPAVITDRNMTFSQTEVIPTVLYCTEKIR